MKQKVFSLFLALVMMASVSLLSTSPVQAAEGAGTATITSMDYFSASDGPVITKSGVGQASYGFVMPKFNGGSATWNDVIQDLGVNVKVGGSWVDIDSAGSFVYNQNWGHWSDSGFNGYWFTLSATTEIQLYSKANGVTLDYTLVFQNINKTTITAMTPTQGPQITADTTGGAGFTYPVFNNDPAIPFAAVADDLKVYVKPVNSSAWIDIDNNAASGWIYDKNFGHFTDGGGGYWFNVTESINVKLESKTSLVNVIYTIIFNEPVRNSYVITPYDGTTFTANESGAIGVPLPKIDGNAPVADELGNFVYQINMGGQWVNLGDSGQSGFVYSANGYNNMSAANQWGYWVDHIYGLWFQPIQEDLQIRIGYPLNGQAGGNVGDNFVYYTFIGNPNAPRPDVTDGEDISVGTPSNPAIEGMELIWQDEFSENKLDTSKWNYELGYYLNDDPGTWGWGNAELQHYTNSTQNVFIQDGKLNIRALNEPKSFPQDPSRYAQYSSGKINTKDHFSLKYGRVDFRAKLPAGNGIWPAFWMLPQDNVYGSWAASGEIDVMEARGRLPGTSSGAIHFGGQWPANTHVSGEYHFPEGQTIANDFHVYSVVWEEDNIKWYVDGKFFFKANRDQWYSAAAPNNPNAPFDQPFYLIMNLAIGGNFDGGVTPNPGDIPATLQVDYVRVYKDNGGGQNPEEPAPPSTIVIGDEVKGLKKTGDDLLFYVNGATFADLHYKVNNGVQLNVAMTGAGNGNYTYAVNNLKQGDTVEYFFTYNPGQGALDTPWQTYVHGVTQGTPE
ncbi:family 16 glycosylhydrolase [Paenibacillus macerans]|uniref:glycoside hydrolase family 16 protein n=1 Tax=Paenibacillus macerans TaxID=44252 RepID=UPI000EE99DC9|nr:glycoside hydrolase family 16 protein [Paenibacillus macerans]MBS5910148.1 glycoside hydrolase family 16 protein [Paenibacillus macerans]GBK62198.1 glycoside hydrolase family 16 protein [Paenibacillus macerans]GBK68509.1 glycoside hydrolase family 16 protein [Paenibacillus macerans]